MLGERHPKIAMSTKNPRIASPAMDLPLRNIAKAPATLDQKLCSGAWPEPCVLVRMRNVSGAPARFCVVVMAQLSVWRVRGSRNA